MNLRIVSPYRPFPAESPAHQLLGPFDWVAALTMLQASVERRGDRFLALTDAATVLPVPAVNLPTVSTRLMLWILEVSLRYLESDAFDQDSVMVSPDSLVMSDLRPYFKGDLTLLVRSADRFSKRPILNAVQWWPVASKAKLVTFYRQALELAPTLPDTVITWGADSEALRRLVAPIALGVQSRAGMDVSMIEARSVMESLSTSTIRRLERGVRVHVTAPITDFKYLRKKSMRAYFESVFAPVGAAR